MAAWRRFDATTAFCGPQRGEGTEAHDPAACPDAAHQRILDEGQTDAARSFTTVENCVEIAPPSGMDADFGSPFVLEQMEVLCWREGLGTGVAPLENLQNGFRDQSIGQLTLDNLGQPHAPACPRERLALVHNRLALLASQGRGRDAQGETEEAHMNHETGVLSSVVLQ